MRASSRPWVVPTASEPWLSANPVIAETIAPKFGGLAHGVPVCCDWYRNVGSHGTKSRHPAATAKRAGNGWLLADHVSERFSARRSNHAEPSSQIPTAATRYRDQYCV